MEAAPKRKAESVPGGREPSEPVERVLGRLFEHMQELAHDVIGWVELKLKKTQLEIEEQIEAKVSGLATLVLAGVLWALCGLMLLVAAGFGLGAWLGHPAWGFLIVGLVLGVAGFAVGRRRPEPEPYGEAAVGEATPPSGAPAGHPIEPASGDGQVARAEIVPADGAAPHVGVVPHDEGVPQDGASSHAGPAGGDGRRAPSA